MNIAALIAAAGEGTEGGRGALAAGFAENRAGAAIGAGVSPEKAAAGWLVAWRSAAPAIATGENPARPAPPALPQPVSRASGTLAAPASSAGDAEDDARFAAGAFEISSTTPETATPRTRMPAASAGENTDSKAAGAMPPVREQLQDTPAAPVATQKMVYRATAERRTGSAGTERETARSEGRDRENRSQPPAPQVQENGSFLPAIVAVPVTTPAAPSMPAQAVDPLASSTKTTWTDVASIPGPTGGATAGAAKNVPTGEAQRSSVPSHSSVDRKQAASSRDGGLNMHEESSTGLQASGTQTEDAETQPLAARPADAVGPPVESRREAEHATVAMSPAPKSAVSLPACVEGHTAERETESSEAQSTAAGANAQDAGGTATRLFGQARGAHELPQAAANTPVAHAAAAPIENATAPEAMPRGHVPAGTQGLAGISGDHRAELPTPAANAHTTFAALDAGTGIGAPTWMHGTGQHAEAGFEDPALGWIGVRADLSGGGVHAALVPGSTQAAEVLAAHLPGVQAHMAEQHAAAVSVTVEAGAGNGGGQGMAQSDREDAGRSPGAGNTMSETAPAADSARGAITSVAQVAMAAGSGRYISVMA